MSNYMQIVLKTSQRQSPNRSPPEQDEMHEKVFLQQVKQLRLKLQTGKDELSDKQELYMLLNRIFCYPSTALAELHRQSNRLGKLDIDKQQRYKLISDRLPGLTQNILKQKQQLSSICTCCGFIVQQKDELPTCSQPLEGISSLGISTYLYFKMIINVSVLLAIMLIVYSVYSFATNISAANMSIDGNYSSTLLKYLSISLGSKQLYASDDKQTMYVIGAWIGCGMLAIWALAFVGLKYLQKENEVKILLETKSVSEFSLVVENMPTGMSKEEVQREFKDYFRRIKEKQELSIDRIQVVKYNEGQPFYFNQNQYEDDGLRRQLEMTKQYKTVFKNWILQRQKGTEFKKSKKFRQRKYKQYNRIVQRKKKIIAEITTKIKDQYHHTDQDSLTTTAFITFATNHQKNFILDHNPNNLLQSIKNVFPCFRNESRFHLTRGDMTFPLRILPAPDPEDIVWQNIGVSLGQKVTRKMLTYSITTLILAVSFVITFSLSTAKVSNQNNQLLTLTISLSISIINIIIGQVIEVLTSYERDYTMTNYQISLTLKTVLAQLINSIFIPIVADYFIKQNIYEEGGLIEDIFILGITNSLLYPIAKIINPSYYFHYFYAKYCLIPENKIDRHQYEINELYQKLQFQVGYQHIYVVNLFVFTCFFVSLQPILPLFALIGLLLIYWIEKYTLYNRCQRPVPGTPIINTTMSQMIYFGAIAYTLGSMTWANFLPSSHFKEALLPNIIALVIALLIFLSPYETIFRMIFKNKRMPEISYNDSRIFFTSEYDRLNPATAEGGVKEYFGFLADKVRELQNEEIVVKSRMSYQLEFTNRPNFYKQSSQNWLTATKYEGKKVIQNLVRKQAKNALTPQLISSILQKGKTNRPINLMKSRIQQSLAKLRPVFRKQTKEKEIAEAEQQIQSHQHIANLQRIQSFKIQNMGKNERFTYKPEQPVEEERSYNQYFRELSQVKSIILKAEGSAINQHAIQQPIPKSNPNRFSFKDYMIGQESFAPEVNEEKNITFRAYMRNYDCNEDEDCGEVANRFSINEANILPLCIQEQKRQGNVLQSQVVSYNIANYQ